MTEKLPRLPIATRIRNNFLAGLIIWLFLPSRSTKDDAPVKYEDFSTLKAETAHFTIVYPSNLRERALAVIRVAD